jgi:hypothetical protein
MTATAAAPAIDVPTSEQLVSRIKELQPLLAANSAHDILLLAHDARSFAESNPLQRIWRDSAVAARHTVTLPAVNYGVYGNALLGRDDQITPLI